MCLSVFAKTRVTPSIIPLAIEYPMRYYNIINNTQEILTMTTTPRYTILDGQFADDSHYSVKIKLSHLVYTFDGEEQIENLIYDYTGDNKINIQTIVNDNGNWEVSLSIPNRNAFDCIESFTLLKEHAYKNKPAQQQIEKLINQYLNYFGRSLIKNRY